MEFRSQPISRFAHYQRARRLLLGALLCAFATLGARAAWLTVVRHDDLRARAVSNLTARQRLNPPRGNIFDRGGQPLATNVRAWSVSFSPYGQKDKTAGEVLHRLRETLGAPAPEAAVEILSTRPRWTRHSIQRHLPQDRVLPILERPDLFAGVRIEPDYRREYPAGANLALLLGHVGKISPEDVQHFTRPRYLPDDDIGRAGIERLFEDQLAGHPGIERLHRDARGRLLEAPELVQAAAPGADLHLTIDARLQARAMELLRRQNGTIIAMDVRTGALLAMASWPSYEPARPGSPTIEGHASGWVNLAARGLYPPGSTFKIVVAAAALEAGIDPDDTIYCAGKFHPEGWARAYWCGARSGHGHTTLVASLRGSCNCYYYELAQRLPPGAITAMAKRFGFASAGAADIAGELSGRLPTSAELTPGERTNFSIGQGSMLATPLQVARAFAGLANGRELPTPHLVARINAAPAELPPPTPLRLDARHRALLVEGLRDVVNHPAGTAFKAGIPARWDVAGKTGTAENPRGLDDAWFAGFFPSRAPEIAIVVHIVDADGHGGDIAGPIARDFIAALRQEAPPAEVALK